MINLRQDVFETNSSSTHSITMCTKDTYDKWENGELYFHAYGADKKWYTLDEVISHIRQEWGDENADKILELKQSNEQEFVKYLGEYEFYTFTSYEDSYSEYEFYDDYFVTPNGDTVVAFGYFGNNY